MDDNFETVPFSYLRADRRLFVNTQFMLQLDDVDNPNTQKGRHWFVDALAYEPGTEAGSVEIQDSLTAHLPPRKGPAGFVCAGKGEAQR